MDEATKMVMPMVRAVTGKIRGDQEMLDFLVQIGVLVPVPQGEQERADVPGAAPGSPGESLESQIGRLASFIMEHIPGEPSQDEGAVDCAIRVMGVQRGELARLRDATRVECLADRAEQARQSALAGEICLQSPKVQPDRTVWDLGWKIGELERERDRQSRRQCPTVIIGEETVAQLRMRQPVRLSDCVLLHADDLQTHEGLASAEVLRLTQRLERLPDIALDARERVMSGVESGDRLPFQDGTPEQRAWDAGVFWGRAERTCLRYDQEATEARNLLTAAGIADHEPTVGDGRPGSGSGRSLSLAERIGMLVAFRRELEGHLTEACRVSALKDAEIAGAEDALAAAGVKKGSLPGMRLVSLADRIKAMNEGHQMRRSLGEVWRGFYVEMQALAEQHGWPGADAQCLHDWFKGLLASAARSEQRAKESAQETLSLLAAIGADPSDTVAEVRAMVSALRAERDAALADAQTNRQHAVRAEGEIAEQRERYERQLRHCTETEGALRRRNERIEQLEKKLTSAGPQGRAVPVALSLLLDQSLRDALDSMTAARKVLRERLIEMGTPWLTQRPDYLCDDDLVARVREKLVQAQQPSSALPDPDQLPAAYALTVYRLVCDGIV